MAPMDNPAAAREMISNFILKSEYNTSGLTGSGGSVDDSQGSGDAASTSSQSSEINSAADFTHLISIVKLPQTGTVCIT